MKGKLSKILSYGIPVILAAVSTAFGIYRDDVAMKKTVDECVDQKLEDKNEEL